MSDIKVVMTTNESTVVAEYTPDENKKTSYQSEADLEREFIELLKSGNLHTFSSLHKLRLSKTRLNKVCARFLPVLLLALYILIIYRDILATCSPKHKLPSLVSYNFYISSCGFIHSYMNRVKLLHNAHCTLYARLYTFQIGS